MSKVVFALTEQQYDVIASIANGGGVPYKRRAWSTAQDLQRKGWIEQDGRTDTYRMRYKLTVIGQAIVALGNAIAAAAAAVPSASGAGSRGARRDSASVTVDQGRTRE